MGELILIFKWLDRPALSLYSQDHVTFEADEVYDQRDAQGFIKLNALRLQLLQAAQKRFGE